MLGTKIATRRELLAGGLGLVGVGAGLPNFLVNSALAAKEAPSNHKVVVALYLYGGHDGASDLVPYGHDQYHKLRPNIRYTEKEVHKLNAEVGLHPNLTGFKELYDQGMMAVVQGTGYPSFNYSHFLGRKIWETGDPKVRSRNENTGWDSAVLHGWLGKYCDHVLKGKIDPTAAVRVGGGLAPIAIKGVEHPAVSFTSPTSFAYTGDRSEKGFALFNKLNQPGSDKIGGDLQFVTQTATLANASSEKIRTLAGAYKPKVEYPKSGIANSFRTIAGLINGGLSTRLFYLSQGGFDTHSNQKPGFDNLMTQINGGVSAFYKDLAQHGNADRVLTFTFSEFGRRVKENKSKGTDHGAAQPMFLIGSGVKAGVHGKQPPFDEETTKKDNFPMQLDFRHVYAAILEKWLKTPSEAILRGKFAPTDCIA